MKRLTLERKMNQSTLFSGLTLKERAEAICTGYCLWNIGHAIGASNARRIKQGNDNIWKVDLFASHNKSWPKGKATFYKVGEVKVNIRTQEITTPVDLKLQIYKTVEEFHKKSGQTSKKKLEEHNKREEARQKFYSGNHE